MKLTIGNPEYLHRSNNEQLVRYAITIEYDKIEKDIWDKVQLVGGKTAKENIINIYEGERTDTVAIFSVECLLKLDDNYITELRDVELFVEELRVDIEAKFNETATITVLELQRIKKSLQECKEWIEEVKPQLKRRGVKFTERS